MGNYANLLAGGDLVTTFKTSLLVLGALPVLGLIVGPLEKLLTSCVRWLSSARRVDPELEAAIARHPSMRANAIYKIPTCGKTIFGADPWDLVAKHMCHELNCLECLARRETAA